MEKKRAENPHDWREARRWWAWELKPSGWKQADIAVALGVSQGAVSQWRSAAQEGGVAAVRHGSGGGCKPRLTKAHLSQLPGRLAQGGAAFGLRGEVWTGDRVAAVIQQGLGVADGSARIGRRLSQLGWRHQKPVPRTRQGDEVALEGWRSAVGVSLQKKLSRKDEP